MTKKLPGLCLFTEGCIAIPEGYQDRSVNVLIPGKEGGSALTITRDTVNAGELLDAYVDRQLTLMGEHLPGWNMRERQPIWLGEGLVEGECVHADYLRNAQRIWQQQAVFDLANGQVLVFTLSKESAMSDTDIARFHALLGSFTFNQ